MSTLLGMKRNAFALLMTLSLIVSAIPGASAVVTPGSKCSKVGINQTFNGLTYTCKKAGSKLVWSQGVKLQVYDAAFARSYLLETQERASQILAEAKAKAGQISSPPNCTTRNSTASVSLGADGIDNLLSLIFNNPGICDITIRASAAFLCPDGGVQKTTNYVTSTGIFPLRAGEKLSVALNVSYYFPQVLNECRSLTRYSSSSVRISTYHQPPSVMTLTSIYAGNFNQVEATKKANDVIKSAQDRADKMVTDAKKPTFLATAWKVFLERKAAEEIYNKERIAAEEAYKAAVTARLEAEKVAAEKAAAEKAVAEKAEADAKSKICVVGDSCKVGNTGPGGGVVFYDAGSQQSWGRYLEVAPSGWYGTALDPALTRCDIEQLGPTHPGVIGSGKAHTDVMVSVCIGGAALAARSYRGGGKSDWFLPSSDELNELYNFIKSPNSGNLRQGFRDDLYFSSTFIPRKDPVGADYSNVGPYLSIQSFLNGRRLQSNSAGQKMHVRPVRAF